MEVQGIWFSLLVSGIKPIEGRRKSLKWANLRTGQIIPVTHRETGEIRMFVITHINDYENLLEYLQREEIYRCLPGVTSMDEAIKIYQQWSTPDELASSRFLAIGMKVID